MYFRILELRSNVIEALPVEIDDPEDIVQPEQFLLAQRFPNVTLVEFCVPNDRNKSTGFTCAKMVLDIGLCQGGKVWSSRAEADGTCGEVNRIGIFRPAGIGLQASETTQLFQPLHRQVSQQCLNRVQYRRSVRFYRYAIART